MKFYCDRIRSPFGVYISRAVLKLVAFLLNDLSRPGVLRVVQLFSPIPTRASKALASGRCTAPVKHWRHSRSPGQGPGRAQL
jgi:hypothetical protein